MKKKGMHGWVWVNSEFPHPLAYYLILNQLNIKKIKSTNIILKNKKIKQKNHVGKHSSNPQYFKGKKLESEIFNQLNIKKVKSTKIIFKK